MPNQIRTVVILGFLATLGLAGCQSYNIDPSPDAAEAVRRQDLEGFPYHPLVFHLDLSIFAYQLYTQSLAWPFDPYFEEFSREEEGPRDAFMAQVRSWASDVGAQQVAAETGIDGFRGPGVLGGFENNPAHDPIVYQYSRIYPWAHALAKPDKNWVEYLTPKKITERIAKVQICYRAAGGSLDDVRNETLPIENAPVLAGANDVLLVAEGGTGDKGEAGQPASQSLMALALLRFTEGESFDVHIAFRGSRSGNGSRAAQDAFSSQEASGNPDWITDLGYFEIPAPHVSTIGEVSRGMSTSLSSVLPNLMACLAEEANARGIGPQRIFVTGHSLGGGLAQHFASAMLLGETFGPGSAKMPSVLEPWPWESLKLITYSAPRVGNAEWAQALTEDKLASNLYQHSLFAPWDQGAVGVTHPDILPRLGDRDEPAAYRVLIHTDPITSGVIQGGEHVGQTVYLDVPGWGDEFSSFDFSTHEPMNVRAKMVETLDDDRIPQEAWAIQPIEQRVPGRNAEQAGKKGEFQKLFEANRDYYAASAPGFAIPQLQSSFDVFVELLDKL